MSGNVASTARPLLEGVLRAWRTPRSLVPSILASTMPPRRRQGPPSSAAAPASLASLPDALLERIMGLLEQRDRHCAALVSRRWHAAVHSPDALRSISCHRPGVAALPSLTAWLLRHGRHVRSCHLQCWFGNNAARAWEIPACLGALAAARSLQQLNLYFGCMGAALCVTSWCAALRQLSELELVSGVSELCICSSLAGLTAVTQLGLTGTAVVVDGAAQLPPNVERFSLGCGRAALPLQLSDLTRLSMLVIGRTTCQPDGYAVLTRLGQLAHLSLASISDLPACLPQLAGLQELTLFEAGGDMELAAAHAAVNAALQQLTALTSLCIVDDLPRCHTPPALAGLGCLQRCCLCGVDYGAELEAPLSPLPPGPWAASLRSLGAGLDVLARSAEVLATATQLTRLALTGNSLYSKDQAAFWEWAGSHPSLRRLQIEVDEYTDLSGPTLHAICSLARERPQLEVATEMAEGGTTFDI